MDFQLPKPEPSRVAAWVEIGRYFGYPDCCIQAFVDKWKTGKTEEQQKVLDLDYGFMPCPVHALALTSGIVGFDGVITSRKHSKPFPVVDDEEYEKWMRKNHIV